MRLEVIPVLVGGEPMPSERDLPPRIAGLPARQAIELHSGSRWRDDCAELIARLERIEQRSAERPTEPEVPRQSVAGAPGSNGEAPGDEEDRPPGPSRKHCSFVIERMLAGKVVPFLGPGCNSSDRREPLPDDDIPVLPDADELARYLTRTFPVRSAPLHLTELSQHLLALGRASDLYATLTQTFTVPPDLSPTPVHAFLADFLPSLLELQVRDAERNPQLIVTSNYDDALEKAFKREDLPYDLAVYMASGDDQRHFVHIPHEGEPEVVLDGTSYNEFPIDRFDRLEHTVIVKIHGAVDRSDPSYEWEENYVVSENDYIDYLTNRPVAKVVPQQILAKLKHSHCLFLGYTMRDWSLRVFLHRIFKGHFKNDSWAIQQRPGEVDAKLWRKMGVSEVFAVPLGEYVQELRAQLRSPAAPASR